MISQKLGTLAFELRTHFRRGRCSTVTIQSQKDYSVTSGPNAFVR